MMRFIQLFIPTLLFLAGALLITASANNASHPVFQLTIDDAIGPATDDYVERAIKMATLQQAELIVLQMDTPGGLDSAMRSIIKNITNSSVPVTVYVAPTGARAASAGTYILYASHIAAMAPGTNLGAATPVQIGGISPPDFQKEKDKTDKPAPKNNKTTLQKKSLMMPLLIFVDWLNCVVAIRNGLKKR